MKLERIAVVSTDDMNVNDHFGMAESFLIYDISDRLAFVEKRNTEKLSTGNQNHSFDADRFNMVYGKIKDCSKVYVTKIGEGAANKLINLGIKPVIYSGTINGILDFE